MLSRMMPPSVIITSKAVALEMGISCNVLIFSSLCRGIMMTEVYLVISLKAWAKANTTSSIC